jgi:membrane-associated phospholipid phosphatase
VRHKNFRTILSDNSAFLLPYLLMLCAGAVLMAMYPKDQVHIFINEHTYGKADLFFRFVTFLGDGVTVFVLAFLFLLFRVRNGLLLGLSGILTAAVTQFLKRQIFADHYRPKKFFEGVYNLHFIPGVENYTEHSFPSGHSAAAFALYFGIALLTENKTMKFLLFLLAATVAFSRVYLSQHFFNDIYAGSVIGIASTFIVYLFLWNYKPFENARWLNKSFLGKNASAV